jgi:hypothetical protein
MRWEAITPRKKGLINSSAKLAAVERRMRALGNDLQRKCATYEAPSSLEVTGTKVVTRTSAKTGRQYQAKVQAYTGYRRTNTLKRSWSKQGPTWARGGLYVVVLSSGKIAPYNVFVRGRKRGAKGQRQAKAMAARGWKSIDAIMDEEWPAAKRDFKRILGRVS